MAQVIKKLQVKTSSVDTEEFPIATDAKYVYVVTDDNEIKTLQWLFDNDEIGSGGGGSGSGTGSINWIDARIDS